MTKKGYLLLEDGTIFEGDSFGYEGTAAGEVVFTTSMVGYPESLTDPSYHGQILTLTYPLIGNYGIPEKKEIAPHLMLNWESDRIWITGLIVSTYINEPSHFSSVQTLSQWLRREKKPALSGIDTRALTQIIREHGVMKGQIIFDRKRPGPFIDVNERNLVDEVSIDTPVYYRAKKSRFSKPILFFDCGVKHGMIRDMIEQGMDIHRVPWDFTITKPEDYAGVMISNGPGDPVMAGHTIAEVKKCLSAKMPVFGICLGNQILALAAGAKTYKLKYGHRSCNQPVNDRQTNKSYITTQNHGFAVDTKTLPKGWKEWMVNLNDGTNEGIRHETLPFFTVQFHAEAKPGPWDTGWLFDYFAEMIQKQNSK